MIPNLLLICLSWFSSAPVEVHDFHVSRLTLNYRSDDQRLEVTLDTFIDDLETILGEGAAARAAGVSPSTLDLVSPTEHPLVDTLLANYLNRVLQPAGGLSALRFLGKEAADDPYAVYVYLDAQVDAAVPTAEWQLQSSYLLSLYDDQQNIVVWQRDGKVVDYDLLTRGERTAHCNL